MGVGKKDVGRAKDGGSNKEPGSWGAWRGRACHPSSESGLILSDSTLTLQPQNKGSQWHTLDIWDVFYAESWIEFTHLAALRIYAFQ